MKINNIRAKIIYVSREMQSEFSGKFFVIKLRGENGEKYNILPNSNAEEYETWKNIAEKNKGEMLSGFQYSGEGKYGSILNKSVIPYKEQ